MKRGMTLLTPASDWREGLPCGDGSLCALVYGDISPETILFNHDRLWYGGKVKELPDISDLLPKVRELGAQGDMQGANDLMANALLEKGFQGLVPIFHPALDLKIRSDQELAFQNYRRTLDFSTGETTVYWEQDGVASKRNFFISRKDHIGVLRFTSDSGTVTAGFQLCEHNLSDSFGMDMKQQDPPLKYQTYSDGDKMVIRVTGSDGGEYGAVMKLCPDGGSCKSFIDVTWSQQTSSLPLMWGLEMEHRNTVRISDAKSITAVIKFYINTDDGEREIKRLFHDVDELTCNYDELLARHVAVHQEIFDRLAIEIEDGMPTEDGSNDRLLLQAYQGQAPAELLVKEFDIGRYLLMCCSNEDGLPPTLQGTFNGDYFPAWNSFYVHNENTQMFYWQALSGRMPEVMGAMFHYFENFVPDYQTNAKNLFGCRGIFIPLVGAANTGLLQDPQAHEINFTGCAAWIASHFYDYYLYTGDEAFLKEHALPFMEQVALFYEDYLTMDQDGKYTIFPSNSPENAPSNSVEENTDLGIVMNPGIPTTYNSTIDTALVKEIFTNVADVYEKFGIHQDKQVQYREMVKKLRAYRINSDGALAEWIPEKHKDNYAHRHLSHIYPFFPGHELTKENAPKLVQAVKIAVDKRLSVGLASQTGWSLVHLANIYARLDEGDKALECLDVLARTCVGKNLFTYHNDYRGMGVTLDVILGKRAPYQIDASMGLTSAIIEMMMSSTSDALRIAPAIPKRWIRGKIATMSARCGCDCAVSWDYQSATLEAVLTARDSRDIMVVLPDGYTYQGKQQFPLSMEKGKQYQILAEKR